jgi:hypothetical protein
MPFGLTFSQLLDLANAVPGLVDDLKAAQPKLDPVLSGAAHVLGSPELQTTLAKVDALLDADDTRRLLTEAAALIAALRVAAPAMQPVVLKAQALLKIIATSENHAQAVAAARTIDIAGSADRN